MLPGTLASLLAFLTFVVPGLAFELLRERRRPSVEETAFREASRIGLASVLFTGTSVLVLLAIQTSGTDLIVDPGRWLREGSDYAAGHLRQVVATVVLLLVLSLLLAVLVDGLLRARGASGRIASGSIWFALFRQHRPATAKPWVHLRLEDETEVWGYAGDYTPDQRLENRELLIEGPKLQYRRKGAEANTQLPRWSFVAVRGSSIIWMKVQYIEKNPDGTARVVPAVYPKQGWIQRRLAGKPYPRRRELRESTSANEDP